MDTDPTVPKQEGAAGRKEAYSLETEMAGPIANGHPDALIDVLTIAVRRFGVSYKALYLTAAASIEQAYPASAKDTPEARAFVRMAKELRREVESLPMVPLLTGTKRALEFMDSLRTLMPLRPSL